MQLKCFLLCATTGLFLVGCNQQSPITNKQKSEIEKIAKSVILDMLENEPEIFVGAIDRAMQKQQRQAAQKIELGATESQQRFWASKLVIGNKDAKLKLAVFFDPLDPVSQKFNLEVMDLIVKERSDVGFFLIPVSIYGAQEGQSGPSSLLSAQALIAASWQNPDLALALWSKMPNINKEFPKTKLLQIATEIGLDATRLDRDIKSDAARQALVGNGKLAVDIGIPAQLPVIFIRKSDGNLELIPPFVKEKLALVLDAIRDDRPWIEAINDSQTEKQTNVEAPTKNGNPQEEKNNNGPEDAEKQKALKTKSS